jgi:uncharacterized SAM-binding protein YcdF (DUF218 family)
LYAFHNLWLPPIGAFLIHEDPIVPSDAVLILGGGKSERVRQGVELYEKNYAGTIIITGQMARGRHWAVEAGKAAEKLGVPPGRILLVLNPKSTYDDAVFSKELCLKNGIKSVIAVTEPYHTTRAGYTFRKVYRGSGIKVMMYPVQDSWYKKESWWEARGGPGATLSEYAKLAYYFFRGRL